MQQDIIPPVPVELLEAELRPELFLRHSNKGHNHLYVTDAHESPNIMREIGRLREEAFRQAGGGTGKSLDIDRYDTMERPCKQLIVWDPENHLILGGYRYILGPDIAINPDGTPDIATSHMFEFSPRFMRDYLPHTVELGRSFVRVGYQSTQLGAKAIFALDNLWDGLGALTVRYPGIKYMFGKMTMYPEYSRECRDLILYFMSKHFPDPDRLVYPREPIIPAIDSREMARLFTADDFKEDYRILNNAVRAYGTNIPPLVNSYMSLSPTMHMLGTAINDEFGDVEETGILIAIDEIFDEKKRRHIESYDLSQHL